MYPTRRLSVVSVLLIVLPGCATRISIPDVAPHEVRAVSAEIGAPSLETIERRANFRYWDIVLSSLEAGGHLDSEQRAHLASTPRSVVVQGMHEAFVRETQTNALNVVRVSPRLLDLLAEQSTTYADGVQYRRTSAAVAELQQVVSDRVHRVAGRVIAASDMPQAQVVVDPLVGFNASVPVEFGARTIFVGPELALHALSDDELACVVGHELAHLTEGHTTSGAWVNVGKTTLTVLVAGAAAAAMAYANQGAPLTQSQADAAVAMGQLTTFLTAEVPLRLSGWGRAQEREADAMGLYWASRAGFSPDGCADFMVHLAQAEQASGKSDAPRWWTTHPLTAERIVALRKLAEDFETGRLQADR